MNEFEKLNIFLPKYRQGIRRFFDKTANLFSAHNRDYQNNVP